MATKWGLIVEENHGYGRANKLWAPHVIGHLEGTHEQAMRALRKQARDFSPVHPTSPRRRRLYEQADGILLVVDGVTDTYHCRFSVAELIHDSADLEMG
ncbi:hypothetical protein DVA86_11375 [Streptomyces armeniacus]|uniref:Uncharacterized protein n=1 Tax=Streptomyces armeniacus TaxID=83291 RepID=A0A345XNE3_9ACTN|nr:hypothetical protein [Streptomyces armeniacus]AXK33159.1 hypothetical protein DVA86_11375 [Streptomyces armeniacus]